MRADAPSFTPSANMGIAEPDPEQSLNDALLKALMNERAKNRTTRLALDAAQTRSAALSLENKTLKASKNLLEAIIEESAKEPAREPIRQSILYDALSQQRQTYETKGYPDQSTEDTHLFDLSLLPLTTQNSSVFRHFLDEDTATDSPTKSLVSRPGQDLSEGGSLIDVSLHSGQSISKLESTPTIAESGENYHGSSESIMVNQLSVNMDKLPTLQLPADFLAKYRPAKKNSVVVVEETSEADTAVEIELESHLPAKMTPVMVPEKAAEQAITVQTTNLPKGFLPGAVRVPMLDLNIRWAMNSLVPAFQDEREIERAKQSSGQFNVPQGRNEGRNAHGSYFWQHPVRYLPNPTEKNLYRTVMVDYIPLNATIQDVLEHVRTGALESIELFPPLRGSTDFFTARVVFVYEKPAVNMTMQYQKKLNQGDPIKIKGREVRFWQVLQPTYPANKQLEEDIFQDGYTRILLFENVETCGVLPKLHIKLAPEMRSGHVIKIWRTTDGVPMVEFTSIAAAVGAFRRLRGDREFKDCLFDFDRDYCEDDYESG